MDVSSLIDAGGIIAFATIVYFQLREQTKILNSLSHAISKLAERQCSIMERQRMIAEDLHRSGTKMRVLPKSEVN